MELDLIIRNGLLVSPSEVVSGQDVGISEGTIRCIGRDLPVSKATKVIDADGGYVTPGGVDTHVHLQQWNSAPGDTWETGTRSAICGGTTTIVAFALQKKDMDSVLSVVDDYSKLAEGNSYCDYGLHLICTKPTEKIINEELPQLKAKGITSLKLYMTYDPMKLRDREVLDIMTGARRLGLTVMIHAENHDMIDLVIETLEKQGLTDPYYHSVSRPPIAEAEATYRAISMAELMDAPILLVHVSSETAAKHIREAQTRLLPIYAETCPQYLWLLSERLKGENFEGAKCVCSPPPRDKPDDLDAIWRGIANGTFTTFSSDHAASKFLAEGGKRRGLINGRPFFRSIPNGLPGVETRLALLFKGISEKKLSIQDFVRVAASNPARLYGLHQKGSISPGKDADLVIWYPDHKMQSFELNNEMLHHDIDYTPYEGMNFINWPRWTILRGKIVWDRDGVGLTGTKGDGQYIERGTSALPGSRNVFVNEWRPPA